MEFIDFNSCRQSDEVYEGMSGKRIGIIYNGEKYLLKYPNDLKDKDFKNVELSYSNSPLCEYIGSHIYGILDFPVHETFLGTRKNKVVVACKDFKKKFERLQEFGQIKVTKEDEILDSNNKPSSGFDSDLQATLETIETNYLLKGVDGVKDRFWDMFVIDALIGNGDRNNKNWGLLIHSDETKSLAPIFDNGNSFNHNWAEAQFARHLSSSELIDSVSFSSRICVFTLNDKRINPYHYIERHMNPDCDKALVRNVPRITKNLDKICGFINDIPEEIDGFRIISPVQKKFYTALIRTRLDKVLAPAYQRVVDREKERTAELKTSAESIKTDFDMDAAMREIEDERKKPAPAQSKARDEDHPGK